VVLGFTVPETGGCVGSGFTALFGMDWQETAALAIVATVTALFAWARLRPRKFSFQRDTHCGCASPAAPPKSSIIFHARKGERGQIVMRMK